ncbi:hypothetical protein H0N98_05115 [Candidatus Micrarchaeota archaeon]|nr:hypothetical protein [Candidatus Micrarchaeota archaeon]
MKIKNKIVGLCFVLILLLHETTAHPGWVRAGVTAYYQGIGAFKKGEEYNSGATMDITERVDSYNNGNIAVTSIFREPTSGYTITNTSSYGPNDALGAFWYDDKVLQSMKTGDKVNVFIKGVGNIPFTVTKGPYQDRINGKTWDAVMLEMKDKAEFRLVYDEKTGLLLHQAEVYPSQETYIDIKSTSVDLSTYQTPGVSITPPVNSDISGQDNTGGTNGTASLNPNNLCGSLFFILTGATLAFIRR